MTKHTPTPWQIEHNGTKRLEISAPDRCGYLIAQLLPDSPCKEANAALIVRAVNSHDDLVASLKAMIEFVQHYPVGSAGWAATQDAIKTLAKVTGD